MNFYAVCLEADQKISNQSNIKRIKWIEGIYLHFHGGYATSDILYSKTSILESILLQNGIFKNVLDLVFSWNSTRQDSNILFPNLGLNFLIWKKNLQNIDHGFGICSILEYSLLPTEWYSKIEVLLYHRVIPNYPCGVYMQ